jgi:hypothetical protein
MLPIFIPVIPFTGVALPDPDLERGVVGLGVEEREPVRELEAVPGDRSPWDPPLFLTRTL